MTRTYIIAEAGVNHDGDEARARALVDIAARAKADAVKFQLFDPTALVTGRAPTAEYQARNLNDNNISQRDMLAKLTLPEGALVRLAAYCTQRGLDFLCTPFDQGSLNYLVQHTSMRYLKLPSGEVSNGPFLLAAARTGMPIILSTGMSSLEEVGTALSILHFGYAKATGHPDSLAMPTKEMLAFLTSRVSLLHCVSQYPAPVASTNLRALDEMREVFELPVGLSDHSLGITMTLAAVARGAAIIEKHFTYDTGASGPDHGASLTPQALCDMVEGIREIEMGLGDGKKICQPEEVNTRAVARRSVVAAFPIAQGETFSESNLTCKRPATGGVVPNQLWRLLGKKAKRGYDTDDFIEVDELV